MGALLASKNKGLGYDLFHDVGFRDMIEVHLPYLRELATTSTIVVDEYESYVYEGDFYAYLDSKGIPHRVHWTILRMNSMVNPNEFDGTFPIVLIPRVDTVEGLMSRYVTNRKKETR
jgi:hypothetical protein